VRNIFSSVHPGIFGSKSIEFVRPDLLPILLEELRFLVDVEGQVRRPLHEQLTAHASLI
jgi:hypothetical protein